MDKREIVTALICSPIATRMLNNIKGEDQHVGLIKMSLLLADMIIEATPECDPPDRQAIYSQQLVPIETTHIIAARLRVQRMAIIQLQEAHDNVDKKWIEI